MLLVTGGAGFIGSHLVEHLLQRGWGVIALDDLSAGNVAHLAAARSNAGFQFVQGNAADPSLLAALIPQVDAVFHLAAVVGVRRFAQATPADISANLRSCEVVFEAASARKLPVFFASSSEVYGARDEPCLETAPLTLGASTVPRWSYAATKITGEHLALAWGAHGGSPAVVGRFFNTVGPRQSDRYGMVLPSFVRAALSGAPLLVHGDGTQTRSFALVDDVVETVTKLTTDPAAFGQIFNIGSDVELSILGLAQRVKQLTGSSSPIELVPYAQVFGATFEDPQRRVPDLSRVRRLTGTLAPRPIETIITKVIEAMRASS